MARNRTLLECWRISGDRHKLITLIAGVYLQNYCGLFFEIWPWTDCGQTTDGWTDVSNQCISGPQGDP